jgi:pimeloyl-ACP methyl ester carboxylesterase
MKQESPMLLRLAAAVWLIYPVASYGQSQPLFESAREGLWLCRNEPATAGKAAARKAIVIGFVGGFVGHDDRDHPEVQFATCLREHHPSTVRARVFSNREGKKALRQVLKWLAADGHGALTAREKKEARIIIYGHSWGAAQTVRLARRLGERGIPVLLTIQVDSVHKPWHDDSIIPANVRNAINFYQTRGPIHGRSTIRAADPERTAILGNILMEYERPQTRCSHCSWFARTFSRTHCQIEYDPRVWDQIASLVNSELTGAPETGSGPSSSQVAGFN